MRDWAGRGRETYNTSMLSTRTGFRLRALGLTLAGLMSAQAAWAQALASPPQSAGRPSDPVLEAGRGNQTIERIRTEDAGSRIDELRVGGQTQSIVVQPKGDMPAYEVRPIDARSSSNQGGARVWNFLRF